MPTAAEICFLRQRRQRTQRKRLRHKGTLGSRVTRWKAAPGRWMEKRLTTQRRVWRRLVRRWERILTSLLDTHGSPTPELSVEFARRVAPFKPLFLEEPVKVGSLEALMEVTRKSPVPIATGEKLFTIGDFKSLIDNRACAVLQPDVTHCFGITTLVDIAKLAAAEQMLMAPHNAGGPLMFCCHTPRRCGHEQLSHSRDQQPTFTIRSLRRTRLDDKGWTRQPLRRTGARDFGERIGSGRLAV